ncbi:C-GCAxxG-C-C family protein [Candidatus Hydrogenedentota bacterium]
MNSTETAKKLFEEGYNCSQAVLAAFGERFGLEREMALRVASGFGGGMRRGETCGAVTGALMVLGLRIYDLSKGAKSAKKGPYSAVEDFARRFIERNGSVSCKELLGCDISIPEDLKKAEEEKLFTTLCPKLVEEAAEILEEML